MRDRLGVGERLRHAEQLIADRLSVCPTPTRELEALHGDLNRAQAKNAESAFANSAFFLFVAWGDLNLRPSGYEAFGLDGSPLSASETRQSDAN